MSQDAQTPQQDQPSKTEGGVDVRAEGLSTVAVTGNLIGRDLIVDQIKNRYRSADAGAGGVTLDVADSNLVVDGDIVGRDKIVNRITNIFQYEGAERARRNLLRLLERVDAYWFQGVLHRELGDAPLAVGRVLDPTHVAAVWDDVMQPTPPLAGAVAADVSWLALFDAHDQSLLLLGDAGSGKTIGLLQLAQQAAERALRDATRPIPVIFNLTSWDGQPLDEWLVEELQERYKIPSRLGRTWVDDNQLMLLLDSFDEVPDKDESACIEAINQFHSTHGLVPLVVASRTDAYAAHETLLKCGNAVVMQPLSAEQINQYLINHRHLKLRSTLRNEPELRQLAQTPLMLSLLLTLDTEQTALLKRSTSADERRNALFEAYVNTMLERRRANQTLEKQVALGRLQQLAQRLQSSRRSVLQIEQLQPDMLPKRWQRLLYLALTRHAMSALLLAFWMLSALIDLAFLPNEPISLGQVFRGLVVIPLLFGAVISIPMLLLDGIWFERRLLSASWIYRSAIVMAYLVLGPMLYGLIQRFIYEGGLPTAGTERLVLIGFWGFWAILAFGLNQRLIGYQYDIDLMHHVRWTTRSLLARIFYYGWRAFVVMFIVQFVYILIGVGFQTLMLGIVPATLQFVRASLFVGIIVGVLFGVYNDAQWIELRPDDERSGVAVALNNWLRSIPLWIATCAVALVATHVSSALAEQMPILPAVWLGIASSLQLGLLIATVYGGRSLVYYFILRQSLQHIDGFGSGLEQFLSVSAEQAILRKAGGGYMFVYRDLQTWFAQTEFEESPS